MAKGLPKQLGLDDTMHLQMISKLEPVDADEQDELASEITEWIEEGELLLNRKTQFGHATSTAHAPNLPK